MYWPFTAGYTKAVPNAVTTEKPFLPYNLSSGQLFNIPLHPAMLQKISMTRRFICHHGMLQPLRWLDVRSTVVVGQRCHFSTEKCNKFTVPQLTQGKSSQLEGPLTQQPWMKTWYCQVRRFGEDVCAPRVAAQMDLTSIFVDPPSVAGVPNWWGFEGWEAGCFETPAGQC